MINPEIELRTSAECCTQIASYFDIVDNCIALSDTNKQYTISPQTSYAPSPPIPSNSYTSAIISPNTHNTADIYNGFIKADLEVKVKMEGDGINGLVHDGHNFGRVWFGFKDARDAVEKYEIVANGITIYTQNFGCEESFLTACTANETTKRADVYSKARHKDIWNNNSGNRTGFIVDWNNKTEDKQKIHLKIDLRRFLPLSNIKYLPAFAGKIELRLIFSCAAMVCCPLGPDLELQHDPYKLSTYIIPNITNEFTPIGEPITMFTSIADKTDATTKTSYSELTAAQRTFRVAEYTTTVHLSPFPKLKRGGNPQLGELGEYIVFQEFLKYIK